MDNKTKIRIRYDHEVNKLSYRNLGLKYGISHTTIYGMLNIKRNEAEVKEAEEQTQSEETPLPEDLKTLKKELREARLTIELQDMMISIASKELGVDLRKKHGTR